MVAVSGVASFLSIPRLAAALDRVPDGPVRFELTALRYVDAGCRELLMGFADARRRRGDRVELHLPTTELAVEEASSDAELSLEAAGAEQTG